MMEAELLTSFVAVGGRLAAAAVAIHATRQKTQHKAASIPATTSKQHCRMVQVERFFRQVECCFDIVAKIGNNVEATFDFVERMILYDKLVRHGCRFWQQSGMLLRKSCHVASTLNEWKCEDFKCVWKPTESRLCLTHYVNKSSRWAK